MILTVDGLRVSTGSKMLVNEVTFSIRKGEWFALVGQSGSGKSILARSIGQMLGPNLHASGTVLYRNENLLQMSKREIRKIRGKRLAYIFQDYKGSFTPFRTIGQHFTEYQRTHGVKAHGERKRQAASALAAVGLDERFLTHFPFQLSGGQLQRASIAIALLFKPDLVIADEVTTALDSVSSHRILELLSQLQANTGCAILFITHDWRHVRRYADHIAVMKEGVIVESGGKHRVLDHPRHSYTKQLIEAAPMLGRDLPSGLKEVETQWL